MVALNVGDRDRTAPLEQVAIEKGVVFRDADVGRVFRLFSPTCAHGWAPPIPSSAAAPNPIAKSCPRPVLTNLQLCPGDPAAVRRLRPLGHLPPPHSVSSASVVARESTWAVPDSPLKRTMDCGEIGVAR